MMIWQAKRKEEGLLKRVEIDPQKFTGNK